MCIYVYRYRDISERAKYRYRYIYVYIRVRLGDARTKPSRYPSTQLTEGRLSNATTKRETEYMHSHHID